MPPPKEMAFGLADYTRQMALLSSPVQPSLEGVAKVVQDVVNTTGRDGDLVNSGSLLVAYQLWQAEARRLLQHHWSKNPFHQWPDRLSLALCADLDKLANSSRTAAMIQKPWLDCL